MSSGREMAAPQALAHLLIVMLIWNWDSDRSGRFGCVRGHGKDDLPKGVSKATTFSGLGAHSDYLVERWPF